MHARAARCRCTPRATPPLPRPPFPQILLWVSAFISMLLDNIPYTIVMGARGNSV